MSSPAARILKPEPRLLTPEASNVLAWWWLAIVTTIVLLCSMWPSIFVSGTGGMSSMSTYLLVIISAVLIALGIWCSLGFSRGQSWSARAMRLVVMIGLGVGLAGVSYFLYSVAFAPESASGHSFFGPSGVLSGILWGMIIILPFIFGLTLIFGLMNDAVDEWFNPPPAYELTDDNLKVNPRTAAIIARGNSADMGDEALMGELSEAMSLTGNNRSYDGDQSIEVIGSSEEDLSVEVIGSKETGDDSSDSMAELAALEVALTEDASKKIKGKQKADKKKEEKKYEGGKGEEPLAVDDDFKL
ncbi:MAG TPA: hypothetical protein PLN21_16185 [Gemmatales bacterium]|nr:hypothetical protein [Gemmatales bacterium]